MPEVDLTTVDVLVALLVGVFAWGVSLKIGFSVLGRFHTDETATELTKRQRLNRASQIALVKLLSTLAGCLFGGLCAWFLA